MKVSELSKIVEKAKVTKDEENDSRLVVDLVKPFNKLVSVEATSEKEAREKVLDIIVNESENIRGFSLEEV